MLVSWEEVPMIQCTHMYIHTLCGVTARGRVVLLLSVVCEPEDTLYICGLDQLSFKTVAKSSCHLS